MTSDFQWSDQFRSDIEFGYLDGGEVAIGSYSPQLVLNTQGMSVQQTLLQEMRICESFTFSVAFVTPSAIAQLKQHFLDFAGKGRIITSDFQNFNEPRAFAELLTLQEYTNIEVRRHTSAGFHPKGYVFFNSKSLTTMVGSSNLTVSALATNHEWNLKVSALLGSDLAEQLGRLVDNEMKNSEPLTHEWIEQYATTYVSPRHVTPAPSASDNPAGASNQIQPNSMQKEALRALARERALGHSRALLISATGTGKTMLSALDVRAFAPERLLFIVHREQILDRTISEYKRVLGGAHGDYGKLTGNEKRLHCRYVFATIQTLSQDEILSQIDASDFDYIIVDEAHRSGSATYQKVLAYVRPKFLLGMTATPERTDGFNVFELFDFNVPYEIRLNAALEANILCPFHYYGVSDITFEDGSTTTDATQLSKLVSSHRVTYLLETLEKYVQSRLEPKGLIFCSRKEEAADLSRELNQRTFRGELLKTVALTGEDSIAYREECVRDLEAGHLNYILTVDVFNEGVDIPALNQVIMLRRTQSAVVFVQQLGRGLRLHEGKEYVVVIDFIGNYDNNFLIPIALYGTDTLKKEDLVRSVSESDDPHVPPGATSVSFDKPSRERVTRSIRNTALDSLPRLKQALISMQQRVGSVPALWDFLRFQSVDPVVLATKLEHYPALINKLLKTSTNLSEDQSRYLSLLSHEVLAGKRLQEFVLLDSLLSSGQMLIADLANVFASHSLLHDEATVRSAIDTLTMTGFPQSSKTRYEQGIAEIAGASISLSEPFVGAYRGNASFKQAVDDLRRTGMKLTSDRYQSDRVFTPEALYTRTDAAHLLGWDRASASTIYGVRTDTQLGVCAIFVTLQKAENVAASTAYGDTLLDTSTLRWFSKSRRTLQSKDVAPIVSGKVTLHVFVKKNDAEGADHYYLGEASAHEPVETTIPRGNGEELSIVEMLLWVREPISQGLFQYLTSATSST